MTQKFILSATGDTLCTKRCSFNTDERFLSLVKILRESDVAFTNLETRIHTFKGYPMPNETMQGNTYQQADPFIADELKWMGFNLIARANNHGLDYGHAMLLEETEILENIELIHAGVGRNLTEATMPGYLETRNGRAALISLCTDFPPHCPAGEQRRDMQGRPGINPLRHEIRYMLDGEDFLKLKEICLKLGVERGVGEKQINLLGNRFVLGEKSSVISTLRKSDLERNLRAIKDARRASNYVFVSIHHHTNHGGPAVRVQQAAKEFINAGADAIIGHGPHVLQGIEIYNKKPIFYSLGNFFYQSETIKKFPAEIYERFGLGTEATPQDVIDKRDQLRSSESRRGEWYMRWLETLLALCAFEDRELKELRLYPLTTYHESRAQRGQPMLASEEQGKKIIDYVIKCSSQWGTDIEFKQGVGYVKF